MGAEEEGTTQGLVWDRARALPINAVEIEEAVSRLAEQNKADLTRCAEDILLAREAHFPATIADLYDPETMPDNLRAAHDRDDETLERLQIGRRFKNDAERLEKLFSLYTEMTARGTTTSKPAARRREADSP